MEHDPTSEETQAVTGIWVPMSEAVRIIARFDGEPLRSPCDIPPKAQMKLIEALRTGRVSSRGQRFTTGEVEEISPRDYQECEPAIRHHGLREPGRRLPRFTSVEVKAVDVARDFEKAHGAEQAMVNGALPQTGRPKGTGYAAMDEPLIAEMKTMIDGLTAKSPTEAARKVIGKGGSRAAGYGTIEAKVDRLVKSYRASYPNRE
jgi:hypothetical protein